MPVGDSSGKVIVDYSEHEVINSTQFQFSIVQAKPCNYDSSSLAAGSLNPSFVIHSNKDPLIYIYKMHIEKEWSGYLEI